MVSFSWCVMICHAACSLPLVLVRNPWFCKCHGLRWPVWLLGSKHPQLASASWKGCGKRWRLIPKGWKWSWDGRNCVFWFKLLVTLLGCDTWSIFSYYTCWRCLFSFCACCSCMEVFAHHSTSAIELTSQDVELNQFKIEKDRFYCVTVRRFGDERCSAFWEMLGPASMSHEVRKRISENFCD